ncbi:MAG TPA: DUF427 domain-containing protein [Candidatus Dormibacteraeota bacterium]|nr:DUF427 domain-containing protein [Candidatus Dormibacteraeota bacterium]
MKVTIKDAASGEVLAEAVDDQARKVEGNWYIAPEAVNAARLEVTKHDYTCPYKGTCFYIDAVAPDGARTPRVAWVYDHPKSGWEQIKGRYGFYAGEAAKKMGKTIVVET